MIENKNSSNVFTYWVVNGDGKLEEVPEQIVDGDVCFLPGIEVKALLNCNNSFLKYYRENDLVEWGKMDNIYHYDLFTLKSLTPELREKIRRYYYG